MTDRLLYKARAEALFEQMRSALASYDGEEGCVFIDFSSKIWWDLVNQVQEERHYSNIKHELKTNRNLSEICTSLFSEDHEGGRCQPALVMDLNDEAWIRGETNCFEVHTDTEHLPEGPRTY